MNKERIKAINELKALEHLISRNESALESVQTLSRHSCYSGVSLEIKYASSGISYGIPHESLGPVLEASEKALKEQLENLNASFDLKFKALAEL